MRRRAAIVSLLLLSRPAAVTWLVVAVWVGVAVDAVAWAGSFAHVGEEVREAVASGPTRADLDATAAVAVPTFLTAATTTDMGCDPTPVLRRALSASRGAMAFCAARGVDLTATARTRGAVAQPFALDLDNVTAVAAAQPQRLTAFVAPGEQQDLKAAEVCTRLDLFTCAPVVCSVRIDARLDDGQGWVHAASDTIRNDGVAQVGAQRPLVLGEAQPVRFDDPRWTSHRCPPTVYYSTNKPCAAAS